MPAKGAASTARLVTTGGQQQVRLQIQSTANECIIDVGRVHMILSLLNAEPLNCVRISLEHLPNNTRHDFLRLDSWAKQIAQNRKVLGLDHCMHRLNLHYLYCMN
jgi:hypothetical protein